MLFFVSTINGLEFVCCVCPRRCKGPEALEKHFEKDHRERLTELRNDEAWITCKKTYGFALIQ